nr:ORF10 [Bracoviriform inaniti]
MRRNEQEKLYHFLLIAHAMFQQLRSSRKESTLRESDCENSATFTDGNKSVNNEKLNSKSNIVCLRKKLKKQRRSKLNTTDCSDTETHKTEEENIKAYIRYQMYKQAKRAILRKHIYIDQPKCMDKNIPTRIVKRHGTILNIPKKRLRSVETITSISSENDQSDIFSKIAELDSCGQFHPDLAQETEDAPRDKNSKSLTRKRTVRSISSSTYRSDDKRKEIENNTTTTRWHLYNAHDEEIREHTNTAEISNNSSEQPKVLLFDEKLNTIPINIQPEQSNSTEMAQKSTLPIQDSSAPNSISDSSNNIHVIDNTIIEPHPLCTENSVINNSECITLTEQNGASTYYINNQPSFSNTFGTVNNSTPNYLPLSTFYTYVAPNPIVELSQKMDRIQESLMSINETLRHIDEAQTKLQNTQNGIETELKNLKIQNLAYENRENWLADNGIILPMKTKEEFTRLCKLLEESSECRKIFEISIHFAINSKRSLTRNIASVIRKYFICKLANQFTAVRYVKDKDVLANTSFYKHLLKNFLEKSAEGFIFSGLTEMEFNKALGEVLCNAKDWKKKIN